MQQSSPQATMALFLLKQFCQEGLGVACHSQAGMFPLLPLQALCQTPRTQDKEADPRLCPLVQGGPGKRQAAGPAAEDAEQNARSRSCHLTSQAV